MALNTTFRYEKSIYKVFALWHEQTDIIFQTAFGILHIDAIKENFFSDFLKIASVDKGVKSAINLTIKLSNILPPLFY
jgi:hypothetical protein